MDQKDIRILTAIAQEGTGSPDRIAQATEIPKSTVHYRIGQMRERGVIKNDLYDIDLEQVGLSITVISEIWAEYEEGYHARVGDKVASIEGVNQVYFIMGDTDFIAISFLPNRKAVERLIEEYESIEEIERTSSKFVISTVKEQANPFRDYEVDSLLELDILQK